jgi:mRNA interferase HigB
MKVHLIKERTVQEFALANAGSHAAFQYWLGMIRRADWTIPSDILEMFSSADLLGKGSNRVVFNIAGNAYRMICKYAFGKTRVHLSVRWIGTHAEYDKLNKLGEQYTVRIY